MQEWCLELLFEDVRGPYRGIPLSYIHSMYILAPYTSVYV